MRTVAVLAVTTAVQTVSGCVEGQPETDPPATETLPASMDRWVESTDPTAEWGREGQENGLRFDRVVQLAASDSAYAVIDGRDRVGLLANGTWSFHGRRGDGPAEFRALTSIGAAYPDGFVVWDLQQQRVSWVTASGVVQGSRLPRPIPSISVVGQMRDGAVVLRQNPVPYSGVERGERTVVRPWVKFFGFEPSSGRLELLDSVAAAPTWVSRGMRSMASQEEILGAGVHAVVARGYLFLGSGSDSTLTRRDGIESEVLQLSLPLAGGVAPTLIAIEEARDSLVAAARRTVVPRGAAAGAQDELVRLKIALAREAGAAAVIPRFSDLKAGGGRVWVKSANSTANGRELWFGLDADTGATVAIERASSRGPLALGSSGVLRRNVGELGEHSVSLHPIDP